MLTWPIYFRGIKRYSGVCLDGPVYKQSKCESCCVVEWTMYIWILVITIFEKPSRISR